MLGNFEGRLKTTILMLNKTDNFWNHKSLIRSQYMFKSPVIFENSSQTEKKKTIGYDRKM